MFSKRILSPNSFKLKILHILGNFYLPKNPDEEGVSGVVRATLETARSQFRLGNEVYIATTGREKWWSEWHGVQLFCLKQIPWAVFRFGGRTVDFRSHLAYIYFTLMNDFDVIQGQLYAYLRFLRAQLRVVRFSRDPFYSGVDGSLGLSPKDFSVMLRFSDLQIANSNFIADQLQHGFSGKGNVHVVYNGVDDACFNSERWSHQAGVLRHEWNVQEGETVFLFAGAIVPEKGVIHLVNAFSSLNKKFPKIHLVLVGSSDLWGSERSGNRNYSNYESQVLQVLNSPDIKPKVHVLGRVSQSRMPSIYAACDVLIVPSVWREAFANVVIEALASGRPVIASRIGGFKEVINERCGLLVSPGDEKELIEAMQILVENPSLQKHLAEGALEESRRFSWKDAASQLDSIYRHTLNSK